MSNRVRSLASVTIVGLFLIGAGASLAGGAGCGPLPGDRDGAPAPPPDIVTVYTGDSRYFYLVDTRRALCFFGDRYRPQLTKVPCEEIPEAWEILGWSDTPHAETPYDDGDGAGPIPPLAPPEAGAETNGEPAAPAVEDTGPPPTDDERQSFEQAFVESFCASRQPVDDAAGPPDEAAIAERHGLTPERYGQVRDHVAADASAWRALSARALEACP